MTSGTTARPVVATKYRGDATLDRPGKEHVPGVDRDTEFHGTALCAGEKMMLLFESAN